jgi:hypothetical protein
MGEEDKKNKILFSILFAVAGFAGGLFFLALVVIILSALGLLSL